MGNWDDEIRTLWAQSAADYGVLAQRLPTYVETNRALVQALDLRPGHRILDLACGTGATLVTAFEHQPALAHAWGVDWVAAMTDEMAVRLRGHPVDTVVAPAQGFADRLTGETVDRILCNSAFFQFEHPERVLADCAQLLTPDGTLGFTLPGPTNTAHFLELFHRLGLTTPLQGGPQGPGSQRSDRCTVDNFDQLLAGAGWTLRQVESLTVTSTKDDYVQWHSLPVFRRPEWQAREKGQLQTSLTEALTQTDELPTTMWVVAVAQPGA